MAKLLYANSGDPDVLDVYEDPQQADLAELQTMVTEFEEVQGLSVGLREDIATLGLPNLGIAPTEDLTAFDAAVLTRLERALDIIDYINDYDTRIESLTVRDGAWYSPVAVEAFSAEEPGNEAILAIDGNNTTGWRTNTEPGSITFRVRDHRKNFERIRLWIPASTLMTELQGVTIRAAQNLSMIDDASNVMASGVNFVHTPGVPFQEFPFPDTPNSPNGRKRARYLKLDITGSNNAQNDIMIREIEVRVTIFPHPN